MTRVISSFQDCRFFRGITILPSQQNQNHVVSLQSIDLGLMVFRYQCLTPNYTPFYSKTVAIHSCLYLTPLLSGVLSGICIESLTISELEKIWKLLKSITKRTFHL